MTAITLNIDNAIASTDQNGKKINIADALSGKLGAVKGMSIQIQIENATNQPQAPKGGKPGVPFVQGGNNGPNNDGVKEVADGQVHLLRKDSKIAKLMNLLQYKRGATFDQIKKTLGMTDGGASSYLYYYPGIYGCKLRTEKFEGRGTVYYLDNPKNVKFVEKAAVAPNEDQGNKPAAPVAANDGGAAGADTAKQPPKDNKPAAAKTPAKQQTDKPVAQKGNKNADARKGEPVAA